MENKVLNYVLHLADNSLILGHRLSEWCGHGPIIEVDMAFSNIALDNIGAARSFYQYAAEIENNGKTEDSYPYLRDVFDFKNNLLVELKNGNFADTIARSFYFDNYQYLLYQELSKSSDKKIQSIAQKSLKEVEYHLKFNNDWILRLGDGTDESKQKIQTAIDDKWNYTGELFELTSIEKELIDNKIAVDVSKLKENWTRNISKILEEATLTIPKENEQQWHQTGGKKGIHTEHLGFLLADLQFLQRAYPGNNW
ncbi:MAG: phenylacetate-CoA oxygenase subunit PaaC [Chitinophagaceae bacterium]|nr:phenylacetate-CoA oxygenase subunit PaaC [Chitinophagaceae bacterium]